MDNRAFVETWFRRVWAEEDLGAIDEMMAPKAPVLGMKPTPSIGAEEFKIFASAFLSLVGNVTVEIERFMEDGDWVSILMDIKGTCRKTQKQVSAYGLAMARIGDGQFQEGYNYVDFISLWEQLGTLPPDTMQQCLAGQRAAQVA